MRSVFLGVLLLAGGAVEAVPQAAPRDPMRFLNIHEWHGVAAVVIKGSKDGRSVDRRFSTKFRVEMPVGVRATLTAMEETKKRFAAGGVPQQLDDAFKKMLKEITWAPAAPKKEEECSLSVDDRTSGESLTATAGPETRLLKGFLKMDVAGGTYDLRIEGFDEVEFTRTPQKGEVKKFKQRPLTWGDARKQALPTDKDILSGRLDIKPSVSGLYLSGADVESYFEWTLAPKPLPELELAVDLTDYANWLPEGKEDGFGVGNTLEVKATLRGKGGAALEEKAIRITVHLMESSREPGSATNAPAEGGTDFDLSFDAALNPGNEISLEGRKVAVKDPGLSASSKISSRDFGAHGELVVAAYTDIGRFVEGTTSLQPGDVRIRIPKRDKNSKIAEAWKKGPLAGKADDADDDAQPAGPTHPGDGLTLYEEYRGFFVAGKHVRTDPDMRDYFVLDRSKDPKIKAGVVMFEKATGLKVHWDDQETLLKERRVNFNTKTGLGGEQHGIVIQGYTDELQGQASAVRLSGAGASTPKDFRHVVVARDVQTLPPGQTKFSGKVVMGPDQVAAGLAHELGHTVNIPHHGDDWDVEATWKVSSIGNGQFKVTEVTRAGEMEVFVRREDGKPYPWTKELTLKVPIGVRNGWASGAWDCLMRYDNSIAYFFPEDPKVRVDIHGDETVGTTFCKDKKGTGSNDVSRAPYDRFGDARKGNCIGQIRVKDW